MPLHDCTTAEYTQKAGIALAKKNCYLFHMATFFITRDSLRLPFSGLRHSFFKNHSLAARLLFPGLPLVATILLLVFAVSQRSVLRITNSALARNAQLQAQSVSGGLNQILQDARNQLLVLAAGPLSEEEMVRRLKLRVQPQAVPYREIAFLSVDPKERYVLLRHGDDFLSLPQHVAINALSSPFQSGAAPKQRGQVSISQPVEVMYPLVQTRTQLQNLNHYVLRFTTTVFDANGTERGVLLLSIDLATLRNRLSELTSPNAPFNMGMEERLRGVFFDVNGWMLFQSEDTDTEDYHDLPLRADMFRTGLSGDLGRPDFRIAFRPNTEHADYWSVVVEIREGRSGRLPITSSAWHGTLQQADEVSFAPVTFQTMPDAAPVIIGGVALVGHDFTSANALRVIYGIYALSFVMGLVLFSLCMWWMARAITGRLARLGAQIDARNQHGDFEPLDLSDLPIDLDRIRIGVDGLLSRLRQMHNDQQALSAQRSAEKRDSPAENLPPVPASASEIKLLVGRTAIMQALLVDIAHAAQVNADVLIIGETGTGKELVSAAIHRQSARAKGPFISINCGALDENLLMDTLFGHVKGAFTEAKQARKGAFLAAEGGTLMLDEVGNAAPKVQQALLRALSTRKIRPLGSDHEIPFDTRVIAATNADLRTAGKQGDFRHDLYYRLAVISIHTPPLRQRKEDIPEMVMQFMAQARQDDATGRIGPVPQLSRGALDKLMLYDWPGNVRELKNTITRALAFCRNDILLADDIRLDTPVKGALPRHDNVVADPPDRPEQAHATTELADLNARQRSMLGKIRRMGSVSRQEYQDMAGDISMRTAQYDLQQMVRLNLLRKEGRGPTQRYVAEGSATDKAVTE